MGSRDGHGFSLTTEIGEQFDPLHHAQASASGSENLWVVIGYRHTAHKDRSVFEVIGVVADVYL